MVSRQALAPEEIPVVILAGGTGMRLREETERVPKPMVRIGEQPILWHIMRHFSTFGYRRFMICLGYKSWVVKEYFLNYDEEMSDLRIELLRGHVAFLGQTAPEDWEVTLVETGLQSGSTGRLLGVRRYLDTPYFMFTYGDGVGTVDIAALHDQHRAGGRRVTVTGVKPSSRYGIIAHEGEQVTAFAEKPEIGEGYVSGGFFCIDTDIISRLDPTRPEGFFESDLLPTLAEEDDVGLYAHHGYWHSMDTFRDFTHLNEVWHAGRAPWKTWD